MKGNSTSALPPGWVQAVLPDLVGFEGLISDGDWVETKDQDPDGIVRLIQLADVGEGVFRDRSSRFLTERKARELRCTYLKAGDVLVARMPDPLGRACQFPEVEQPCVTAVDVCIVRAGDGGTHARWLMHFLNAPPSRMAVASFQSGSTRKRISRKNLCRVKLPVPPSREQIRITDALDEQLSKLDAAAQCLQRVQANLKRYRASVLKAAVEGQLVPTEAELARQAGRDYEPAHVLLDRILAERRRRWEWAEIARLKAKGKPPADDGWKGGYKTPSDPDTSTLPRLAEGWCWVTMDQLLAGIEAGKNFRCDEHPPEPNGVGVIKVSAVTWGAYDEKESKTCRRPELVRPCLFVREGDFLFSRANTLDLVGACVLARAVSKRIMLSDKILRLSVLGGLEAWVLWCLRSQHGRREIESLATGNQQSMRNIGQDRIRQIRVPLPPESEVGRIVAEVHRHQGAVDRINADAQTNMQRCRKLRQAILAWGFAGRLVDQDPADEPATAFLERICTQRTRPEAQRARTTTRGGRDRHGGGRGSR